MFEKHVYRLSFADNINILLSRTYRSVFGSIVV